MWLKLQWKGSLKNISILRETFIVGCKNMKILCQRTEHYRTYDKQKVVILSRYIKRKGIRNPRMSLHHIILYLPTYLHTLHTSLLHRFGIKLQTQKDVEVL